MLPDVYLAKAINYFISQHFYNHDVYAIVEANCKSCVEVADQLSLQLGITNPNIHVKKKFFISEQVESLDIKQMLSNFNANDIFILPNTSYSSGVLIARIVDFLKIPNLVFIGGDGWGSWPVDYVGKVKTMVSYNAFRITPRIINPESIDYLSFKKRYVNTFHKEPPEDVICYQAYKTLMSVVRAYQMHPSENTIMKDKLISAYKSTIKNKPYLFVSTEYNIYKLNTDGETFFSHFNVNINPEEIA